MGAAGHDRGAKIAVLDRQAAALLDKTLPPAPSPPPPEPGSGGAAAEPRGPVDPRSAATRPRSRAAAHCWRGCPRHRRQSRPSHRFRRLRRQIRRPRPGRYRRGTADAAAGSGCPPAIGSGVGMAGRSQTKAAMSRPERAIPDGEQAEAAATAHARLVWSDAAAAAAHPATAAIAVAARVIEALTPGRGIAAEGDVVQGDGGAGTDTRNASGHEQAAAQTGAPAGAIAAEPAIRHGIRDGHILQHDVTAEGEEAPEAVGAVQAVTLAVNGQRDARGTSSANTSGGSPTVVPW